MKMIVRRIESINREGVSRKTGEPYHIDVTQVTVDVPFNTPQGFGLKEITYPYGDAANFDRKGLSRLAGQLPIELDVDLGVDMNNYDSPVTIVNDIKLPPVPAKP